MKYIKLTQGKRAIVDDEDFEWLSQWKWHYNTSGGASRTRLASDKSDTSRIQMHREIMKTPKGMDTDHINHNRLDNRKSNLRICTHAENLVNRGKTRANKSGYVGVYWHSRDKHWRAQVQEHSNVIFLGSFKKIEDAVEARDEYVRNNRPVFGVLNTER